MVKSSPIRTAFNAGELSPRLYGRVDFEKYRNGSAIIENMIPLAEGGIIRRAGTRFVAEAKDSSKSVIVVPFNSGVDFSYVMEVGEEYIRFYRFQGRIETSGVAAWQTSTAYVAGDLVTESTVTYYCLADHTSGTFATDLGNDLWYAQTGAIYEIATPYQEEDLLDLRFVQNGDLAYIFHNDYAPRQLARMGNTNWTLTEVEFLDGPYQKLNATTTTLNPSAATGTGITIAASATTGINGGQGFLSTDVGRFIRIKHSTTWGYAQITAVGSTTSVTADVKRDFGAATAQADWKLGAWSETTGWPGVGTIFQQRLYTARSISEVQTVWASQVADYTNFQEDNGSGTVEDDDAIIYTISSEAVNDIEWMVGLGDTLAIGTRGKEWIAESDGVSITPNDISITRQTSYGSARIKPIEVGHVLLFVQRANRSVMEFGYSFEADGNVGQYMTRLAKHITKSGFTQITYAQEPDSVSYAVRGDGQIAVMTYRREEAVVAWARIVAGGANAAFESVCSIPGADGAGQFKSSLGRDEVWTVCKRTIDGGTKRYIEFFEKDWDREEDDQEDAYYSDSLITYDSTATDTITGLGHLEGETVGVLADGSIHPVRTVTGGEITLDGEYSTVQIGIPYRYRLQTIKLEAGNPAGTYVGKYKKIVDIYFVLEIAHVFEIGSDFTDMKEYDFRVIADPMDSAAPFFEGEPPDPYKLESDWLRDPRICIQSSAPVPFVMAAMAYDVDLKNS